MVKLKTLAPPEGFLEPEVRDGIEVSSTMKEIWAVEIDLLAKFSEVCKKYNLRWWADAGTLLGAVRHKGYVPWDDDMDLGMPRSDFNKLLEIGPKEFTGDYFFQTMKSDLGLHRVFVKIRNNNTTLCSENRMKGNTPFYNYGVFIDITCFDVIPDISPELLNMSKKLDDINDRLGVYRKQFMHTGSKTTYNLICRAYDEYHKVAAKYSNLKNPKYYANLCTTMRLQIQQVRPYFDPKDIVMLDFEYIKVPCPKDYNGYLTFRYGGNWSTPIKGAACHGSLVYTPKPFREVLKTNDGLHHQKVTY